MQPLYTEAEFKAAKSRQLLPLRCLHCTQTFHRTKHRVLAAINPHHPNTADFCSRECRSRHDLLQRISVTCTFCQKPIVKHQWELKDVKHPFCSQSCAAKWNNAHKTKGTRVSKLEHWLQDQLPKFYPTLDFHFNRKDAINGELDIYIPSLRLAFELNGIFHYEPIYGPEKLSTIQTNDHRKILACAEHGIELCILDVSSMTYFKPLKGQRFLDIIRGIIDAKLSGSSPVASDCLASTT